MSISFSPSQVELLLMLFTSRKFEDLEGVTLFEDEIRSLYRLEMPEFAARNVNRAKYDNFCSWERSLEACCQNVLRAYARFVNELESYKAGRKNLAAVRLYHRMVIDSMAPFTV